MGAFRTYPEAPRGGQGELRGGALEFPEGEAVGHDRGDALARKCSVASAVLLLLSSADRRCFGCPGVYSWPEMQRLPGPRSVIWLS